MRPMALAALAALLTVSLPAAPVAAQRSAPPVGRAAAPREDRAAAVVTLTNRERVRRRRPSLAVSPELTRAAQLHAEQMARLRRLDHELTGAPYPRPEDRLRRAGYRWQGWAENIASGQTTPAGVLGSWMKSTGHRQNILERSLTEIGVGVATDAAGRTYWVQVFGRPQLPVR